ncbi:MAG: hypothetical protein KC912_09585 [Proteobacteria bacterium]|nr:hypothetical protein [Pseudomonadota bacterium]
MSHRTWGRTSPTRILFAALIAAFTLTGTPAVAGNNLFGGQVVEQNQLYGTSGYPYAEIGLRVPTSERFEITPNVRFDSHDWRGVGGGGSLSPGVHACLQVIDADDFHGSVSFSVPIHLQFNYGNNSVGPVGVGVLYPGFIMDYQVTDALALDFGIRLEGDVYMELLGPQYPFFVRLPLMFGVDLAATDMLQLAINVEAGPTLDVFRPLDEVTYHYRFGSFVWAGVGVGFAL